MQGKVDMYLWFGLHEAPKSTIECMKNLPPGFEAKKSDLPPVLISYPGAP